MSDVQDTYLRVSNAFGAAVKTATPSTWSAQSPCEEWTARDVVAHVVDGHRRVIAEVNGAEARPMGADEDPAAAWEEVARQLSAITADPEIMATQVEGPVGPMPAGQIIGRFVTMDTLVHTWDLARAVGADERLDPDAVHHAYEGIKPMDEMIRRPGVFGPKLEPPAGADLQTEFLYFLGRRA